MAGETAQRQEFYTNEQIKKNYNGQLVSIFADGKWRIAKIVSIDVVDGEDGAPDTYKIQATICRTKDEIAARTQNETPLGAMQENMQEMVADVAQNAEGSDAETVDAALDAIEEVQTEIAQVEAEVGQTIVDKDKLETRTITLNHPPEKVLFSYSVEEGQTPSVYTHFDIQRGGEIKNYQISEIGASADGAIEYGIKEVKTLGGKDKVVEIHRHIPQELVKLWSEVQHTENLVQLEEQKIKQIALSLRAEWLGKLSRVYEAVALAKQHLPKVGEMSGYTQSEIAKIAEKLEAVHTVAKDKFNELNAELSGHTFPGEEDHITTDVEIEEAESERKKNAEDRRKFIATIEREIEADILKDDTTCDEYKKINKEEDEAVAEQKKKEKEEKNGSTKNKPGASSDEADSEAVKLIKKEHQIRRDKLRLPLLWQRDQNIRSVLGTKGRDGRIYRYDLDANLKIQFDFVVAIKKKRQALMQSDTSTGTNNKNLNPNGDDSPDYFFDLSDSSGNLKDPNDSVFATKTYEAYQAVSAEWSKEPEESAKERTENAFNFDDVWNIEHAAESTMKFDIPKKPGTDEPQDEFRGIHEDLRNFSQRLGSEYVIFSKKFSEISAANKQARGINTEADLKNTRKIIFDTFLHEYHELNKRLRRLKVAKEHATATAKEQARNPERVEKKTGYVDIPELVLREALFDQASGSRLLAFKEAMRALYTSIPDSGLSTGDEDDWQPSASTLELFRELVPKKADRKLFDALRPHGVADWGEFKAMWDAHISQRCVEGLAIAADARLRSKRAEEYTKKRDEIKKDKFYKRLKRAKIDEDSVIKQVLTEQCGGDKKDEADYAKATDGVHGLPILTAIMAEAIREASLDQDIKTTAQLKKLSKDERALYEKMHGMSAGARSMYERALRTLEPRDRTEQNKLELAQVISKLTGNGDMLEKTVWEEANPTVKKMLRVLGTGVGYAGFAVGGVLLAPAMSVAVGLGSIASGALVGAGAGFFAHERAEKSMEAVRRASREKVFVKVKEFRISLETYQKNPSMVDKVKRDELKNKLMIFKKLLHGVVLEPKENGQDDANALFVDKRYPGDEHETQERTLLLRQIKTAVHDAEASGILTDEGSFEVGQNDPKRLRTVVEKLKKTDEEATQTVKRNLELIQTYLKDGGSEGSTPKKIARSIGRFVCTTAGMGIGGTVGGVVGSAVSHLF